MKDVIRGVCGNGVIQLQHDRAVVEMKQEFARQVLNHNYHPSTTFRAVITTTIHTICITTTIYAVIATTIHAMYITNHPCLVYDKPL
eukprot:960123-Amorphochlora_amoeboformis.AAC.1